MEAYLLDWANLLLRWVHVITAIAWIGSSFYFVFLDNNLLRPTSPDLLEKGVDGAMWAVHGGGFYNPQKYMVAPKKIHTKLHWFYWESYSTWLTGFALFTVLYLWNAGTFLVDKSLFDWSPTAAGATAVAMLAGFWLVYDLTCRVFGFKEGSETRIGLVMLAVVLLACWLANHLFAGRAAFLLVGAMIATAMSANVFFWIIPGQRQVVAAMTSGEPYDAQALSIHGKRGKQRSVHNTYFTLPVIFAMLSNHYSFLYTHEARWVLLFVMMLAGALIRQFFVQRHAFHLGRASNPWPYAAVGVALLLVLIVALKPATPSASVATAPEQPVTWAQAQAVIGKHCLSCHGPQVQMKGLRFDHSDGVSRNAQNIYQQVVVLQQMPMGNATGMTAEERALLGRWFKAGAPTQ
jgi:uncharacterized membrane protein